MPIRYENYDWIFDKHRWAEKLRGLEPDERAAAQELSGLTESGWYHWLNPDKSKVYEHPGMKNFLLVCNLLHLNPTEFFCLGVKGL